MAFGCIICAEAFASSDGPEKAPLVIKPCGHAFHSSCLKQWLAKSKTCPICRCVAYDSGSYTHRLHLQTINDRDSSNFNSSAFDSLLQDVNKEKDKEIAELRKALADSKKTNDNIRAYLDNITKNAEHIAVELGGNRPDIKAGRAPSVIDLSNTPPSPVAPVASIRPALTTRAITGARAGTSTSTSRVGPSITRVAAGPRVRSKQLKSLKKLH
jgi:hypothetical protein